MARDGDGLRSSRPGQGQAECNVACGDPPMGGLRAAEVQGAQSCKGTVSGRDALSEGGISMGQHACTQQTYRARVGRSRGRYRRG